MTAGLPVDPTAAPDVGVAIASGGAGWEPPLISVVDRHRSGLRLVRRCVDLAELLAVCRAGRATVAIVSADMPRLDRDDVTSLVAAGVLVLLVAQDAQAARELAGTAASVVSASASPDEIAAAARAGRRGATGHDPELATLDPAPAATEALGHGSGRVLAVCSPPGAPGRTTVAVALATALAHRGTRTMLIDADVNGGAVSTALGLLDDTPGLPAACRSAARGRLDDTVLAAHAVAVDGHLRVLTAPARSDRVRELRPSALRAVLDTARSLVDAVVVDCPAGVPSALHDMIDVAATGPGPTTAAVLDAADTTLLVASADAVGLVRLAHALDHRDDPVLPSTAVVVVNRVRRSAAGRHPETHVRRTLERIAPGHPSALLPDDVEAADAAVRQGRSVSEAAPTSPLTHAVAALVTLVRPTRIADAAHPPGDRRRWSRRSIA